MALELSANFAHDIESRDTSLIPIVHIGSLGTEGIRLSTNVYQYYNLEKTITYTALPLLMSVPSLKESINIQDRKYKISSVTLSVSNFPYNGLTFDERMTSLGSIINKECRIYWASPSTYRAYWESGDDPQDVDFLQIYVGTIRNYSIDMDTITIMVEDYSQKIFHKDLPLSSPETDEDFWIGAGKEVPDKYKNQPMPLVYGVVNKSPCVFDGRNIIMDGREIGGIKSRSGLDDDLNNTTYDNGDLEGNNYKRLYIGDSDSLALVLPKPEVD